MRLILFLFALCLITTSCEKDSIQGSISDSPTAEAKYGKTPYAQIDEILYDALQINAEIAANPEAYLAEAFEWLNDQLAKGADVDLVDFLTNDLNVSPAALAKVGTYAPGQKGLISGAVGLLDETTSPLYQRYMNVDDDPSSPWAHQAGCAPDCCGGWRPIKIILLMDACVLALEVPHTAAYVCTRAARELASFAVDGCLS